MFIIKANDYLSKNILAFYHTDYTGYQNPGNPDYINTLKNTFNNFSPHILNQAVQQLTNVLLEDLPQIFDILSINPLTVCVVPRAKAENIYSPNQLLFKATVKSVVNRLSGFIDGTDYILRHTNTRTTHLNRSGYGGDGDLPYVGITRNTCNISSDVKGKDILLIDDLYTRAINIDEDAIQALLDNGANSVYFYSVGKTVKNRF